MSKVELTQKTRTKQTVGTGKSKKTTVETVTKRAVIPVTQPTADREDYDDAVDYDDPDYVPSDDEYLSVEEYFIESDDSDDYDEKDVKKPKQRCAEYTLKGHRCKRNAKIGTLCHQHYMLSLEPSTESATGPVTVTCCIITRKGTPCSRKVTLGHVCTQHAKQIEKLLSGDFQEFQEGDSDNQETTVEASKGETVQCHGIRKDGLPCQKKTRNEVGYCPQHIDQYEPASSSFGCLIM